MSNTIPRCCGEATLEEERSEADLRSRRCAEDGARFRGRRGRRTAGFASVMAVVLLGLVSLAAFSIFAMLTADARRTRDAQLDAQLRQMLIAGAADVMAQSTSWDDKAAPKARNVELPGTLRQEGGDVRIIPQKPPEGSIAIVIEARLQKRSAFQTLTLGRADAHWEVRSCRWGK